MSKHTEKKNVNIPMCVAAFLFCLTLISCSLTGGLYARYTAVDSGSDSARVIKFGEITLKETGDFYEKNKLMVIPGSDLTQKVTVSFSGSESSTYVFAELDLISWSTADNETFSCVLNGKTAMRWRVADGWEFLKADGGKFVYYLELAPNTVLEDIDLIADGGKITVDKSITENEINGLSGVSVNIRASVVQSNGFENPSAAYDSITM